MTFFSTPTPLPTELRILDILARLACAMLVGLIIGGEREFTHRPAGMRTHMLVSLGACTVMITSQLIYVQYHALGANPDPARLSAQVITGVGFLGAGTIMREGPTVKGLTTAASIWTVACLGIAAGGGYYVLTISSALGIFLTLTVFERLQRKFVDSKQFTAAYSGTTEDIKRAMDVITAAAGRTQAKLTELQSYRGEDDLQHFSFQATFRGIHVAASRSSFFAQLAATACIRSISESTDRINKD